MGLLLFSVGAFEGKIPPNYTFDNGNMDAETGDTTGWTTTQGTNFTVITPSGTDASGSYAFVAGDNWANQNHTGDMAVPTRWHNYVDDGKALLEVQWLESNFSGSDYHHALVSCHDNGGTVISLFPLACYISPYRNGTDWGLSERYIVPVPANTRNVRFYAGGNRMAGTQNSAYYDDIEVKMVHVSSHYKRYEIIDSFQEDSDYLDDFTNDVQNTALGTATWWGMYGLPVTYKWYGDNFAYSSAYKYIEVPETWHNAIDAGTVTLRCHVQGGNENDDDEANLEFAFYDDDPAGSPTATQLSDNGVFTTAGNTADLSQTNGGGVPPTIANYSVAVDPGTRYIRVYGRFDRIDGTVSDGYLYAITTYLTEAL